MASQQLAEYFAKFGFKIDEKSVASIKQSIAGMKEHIAKQLNLNVKIEKFTISKRGLNTAIKEAMTGHGGVKLAINTFTVNATELRRSVQAAFDKGVTLRVNAVTKQGGSSSGSRSRKPRERYETSANTLGRFGLRALPAFAVGAGIMQTNAISEDLQSSKMALNTVTGGRGVDAYQWLKNQGNQLGFDYRNQLPTFSSYLGASVNKQGYDNSLTSFKDLTQYGLTHGADKVSMERAMLAMGQMWSKGKIMGEELDVRLAA
jgi:hypothetical protein